MDSKKKGQYVVYERASRDEESFSFLIMAKQVASERQRAKELEM